MNKQFTHCLWPLLLCLALLTGCQSAANSPGQPAAPPEEATAVSPGPIPGVHADNYPRIDGSTANMPLMRELYSAVCGVAPEEAEIMVQASGGTGAVWRNMLYGGADLLLVYEIPDTIKEDIESMDLEIDPLGCDGLVFLVNRQNPVSDLTVEQLRDIYTANITDWSGVGGEPGPISPYQRNEESGSQTLFRKLLMGNTSPMQAPTELVPGSMGGLIDAVAAFDGAGGAIGYSVYYYANLMYADPNLKLLAVNGVEPSAESIGTREYPLVNDFYTVIRADAPKDSPARLVRDWLLTDAGSELLESANYIPAAH